MSALEKIESFKDLKDDWDSYGGREIDKRAISAASAFVAGTQPVPTCRGGIQLEWHLGGMDLEIVFDHEGKVESVLWSRDR